MAKTLDHSTVSRSDRAWVEAESDLSLVSTTYEAGHQCTRWPACRKPSTARGWVAALERWLAVLWGALSGPALAASWGALSVPVWVLLLSVPAWVLWSATWWVCRLECPLAHASVPVLMVRSASSLALSSALLCRPSLASLSLVGWSGMDQSSSCSQPYQQCVSLRPPQHGSHLSLLEHLCLGFLSPLVQLSALRHPRTFEHFSFPRLA